VHGRKEGTLIVTESNKNDANDERTHPIEKKVAGQHDERTERATALEHREVEQKGLQLFSWQILAPSSPPAFELVGVTVEVLKQVELAGEHDYRRDEEEAEQWQLDSDNRQIDTRIRHQELSISCSSYAEQDEEAKKNPSDKVVPVLVRGVLDDISQALAFRYRIRNRRHVRVGSVWDCHGGLFQRERMPDRLRSFKWLRE